MTLCEIERRVVVLSIFGSLDLLTAFDSLLINHPKDLNT